MSIPPASVSSETPMIDHVWTVICEDSVVDHESNNVSLFNVIEQVTFGIPEENKDEDEIALPYSFQIVILWSRSDYEEPESGTGRVQLLDPEGESLRTLDVDIDLTEARRTRNFLHVFGFPLRTAGKYTIQVDKQVDDEWVTVDNIFLEVHKEYTTEEEGPHASMNGDV